MATTLTIRTRNQVNSIEDVPYSEYPEEFITMDLTLNRDYLIWTAGDDVVKDHMTHEPLPDELNAAAPVIDENDSVTVPLCLLMDYSHDVQGSYYTHKVLGMGENRRFVYCFSFDDMTAMIPRLEAWDSSAHNSIDKHVLGEEDPIKSFVKAVRTTDGLPGADWAGTPIAGASNYIELDTAPLSEEKDLYCNLKIVIPANYPLPVAETFCLTCRFTYF